MEVERRYDVQMWHRFLVVDSGADPERPSLVTRARKSVGQSLAHAPGLWPVDLLQVSDTAYSIEKRQKPDGVPLTNISA